MKQITINDLIQDAHNFNKHTEGGKKMLQKSIQENGLGRSILVDKNNNIIAGNATAETAKSLGNQKIKVVETNGTELVVVKRTDVEINSTIGRNLALADNAVASADLDWNFQELRKAMDEFSINPSEFGIDMSDFEDEEEKETKQAKEDDFNEDENEIPARVQKGEVWQLGQHKLICGDSTDADVYARLMLEDRADITFTSPPYNVNNGFNNKHIEGKGYINNSNKGVYKEYEDNRTNEDYCNFLFSVLENNLKYSKDVLFNIGYCDGALNGTAQFLGKAAKYWGGVITWKKTGAYMPFFPVQHGIMANITEPVYMFNPKGDRKMHTPQWKQGEAVYNIIETASASGNEYAKEHNATFPIELPSDIINRFSDENGIVIDCFGGTGTTLIACEQLNRRCRMIELSAHYCDIIIARWEKLTGQNAIKIE